MYSLGSNSGYKCMSVHMHLYTFIVQIGFAHLPASALPHPGETQAAFAKASPDTSAQSEHTDRMKSADKNV